MMIGNTSKYLFAVAASALTFQGSARAEAVYEHRSYITLHGGIETVLSGSDASETFLVGGGIGHDIQFGDVLLGIYGGLDMSEDTVINVRDLRGPKTIEFEARPGRDFELSAKAGIRLKMITAYVRAGYSNARFTIDHPEYTAPFFGARNLGGGRFAGGAEVQATPSISGVVELRYSTYSYNLSRAQALGGLMLRF